MQEQNKIHNSKKKLTGQHIDGCLYLKKACVKELKLVPTLAPCSTPHLARENKETHANGP